MKKVEIKNKLTLNKQTVTILNKHETAEIKGGITPTISVLFCNNIIEENKSLVDDLNGLIR